MQTNPIPSRQIHLDFHTSELIEGVGSRYDPEAFASTLEKAHVNSITLFTRCHHGMLYYDSPNFPELVHPHLVRRDFLESQAAACHRHHINVNLYSTVCWDKHVADHHPEWICIDENGALYDYKGKKYFEAGFYKNLCLNTGYRDFVKRQMLEALQMIPCEGVWFDAFFITECCCPTCIAKMRALGLDPSKKEDRTRFSLLSYQDAVNDLSAFIQAFNPKLTIFYNKGHVGVREKPVKDSYTYYAFESLPGGEWGYMDFPISAKYNRLQGKECLGMTGRFHTEWGDFHSYRNKAALEYECYSMLANGCKCIIGDQMPPHGQLDPYMYEQIGALYADIERREPWCVNAKPVVEAAIFTEEEFRDGLAAGEIPKATEGAARLLMELSYQYDIVDSESDLSPYRVLVLPDTIPVSDALAAKLNAFVENGGKVLCTCRAGLTSAANDFWPPLGVHLLGEAPYSPDFLMPKDFLGENLSPLEHVMYSRGTLVSVTDGGRTVLNAVEPVFNRTWEHFCSHLHSPSSGKEGYPAVVESDAGLYFIHPLFTQYQLTAPPWYKQLVANAMKRLLPVPLVKHNGPSSLITNLMAQENRWVLHLLHYVPQRKCDKLDILDSVIPLHDLAVQVLAPSRVTGVCSVPSGAEIAFGQNDQNLVCFTVPKVNGYEMIELRFS